MFEHVGDCLVKNTSMANLLVIIVWFGTPRYIYVLLFYLLVSNMSLFATALSERCLYTSSKTMNATLFVVQASNAFFQAYDFHHMFDVYLMLFCVFLRSLQKSVSRKKENACDRGGIDAGTLIVVYMF